MTTLATALERVRRAQAILERAQADLARITDVESRLEDTLSRVADRVGRPILKPLRLTERVERIVAPVRTNTLFTRFVAPILSTLNTLFISGSGTFSAEQLKDAQVHVFFSTERGYLAGMEFRPYGGTFYKAISKAEKDELERDLPDTQLLARLFTQDEDIDHT